MCKTMQNDASKYTVVIESYFSFCVCINGIQVFSDCIKGKRIRMLAENERREKKKDYS